MKLTYIFLVAAAASLIDDRALLKLAATQCDNTFNIVQGFTCIGPH